MQDVLTDKKNKRSAPAIPNDLIEPKNEPDSQKVRKIPAAVIGPITARTARRHRLRVKIQPKRYTIPALVMAIQKAR